MAIEVTRTSVHCDSRWHDYYRSIVSPNRNQAMEMPFATMYEAFMTFACLGRYHNTYVPLEDKREIFLAQYFDRERHIPVLVALAYDHLVGTGTEPDAAFEVVTTSSGFVPIVEGWANGGVRIFNEAMKLGNPLATMGLVDLVMQEAKKHF